MAKRAKVNVKRREVRRYLSRRRRRRIAVGGVVVMVVGALAWADRRGFLLYAGDDMWRYHGRGFAVVRVIDGDTLEVDVADRKAEGFGGGGTTRGTATTRVRLWGVDTPETAKPSRGLEGEPLAEEASAFTRQCVADSGDEVVLELEAGRTRGRFGRVVAHVRLSDGSVLNERLLVAGLSRAEDRFEHKRLGRYALLARQAAAGRVGLWEPKEK